MSTVFQPNLFQHSGTLGQRLFQVDETVSPPLTPAQLAELYGGGALHQRGRKKEKHPEPSLEAMVRVVASEPEGKVAVIAAMPKTVRAHFPDPQIAIVSDLVDRIEAASGRVHREIARLYYERMDEDEDDEFLMALF